ncbi:hypothetical protein D3C76_719170 [compost metagenome]
MVGASSISLIFSLSITLSTPCGVKPGTTTCVPPLMNSAVRQAKAARWNIGIECMKRELGPARPFISEFIAEKATLVWLSITPFGNPVVPPV